MTRIEVELLIALFGLYIFDCIHWLAMDDRFLSQSSSRIWKTHQRSPLSFTLIGRTPLLVDPFLLTPGLLRTKLSTPPPTEKILRRISRQLNRSWLLEVFCRVQAILLLLFLPWIIWTQRLTLLWQSFGVAVLLIHISLMISFFGALRRNGIPRSLPVVGPLLLNPLGAIRAMEVFSQSLFHHLDSRPKKTETP